MTPTIRLGANRCVFTGFTLEQLASLKEEFTVYGELVRQDTWHNTAREAWPLFGYDKEQCIGYCKSGFLLDILGYVVNTLRILPEIDDPRIQLKYPQEVTDYDFFGHTLFEHQVDALNAILERGKPADYFGLTFTWPCGIVNAAPNAGKDAIMLGIIANYPDANVLMVVSEPKIADKAVREFTDKGHQVSVVMSGRVPKQRQDLKRVTVATTQVLANEIAKGKTWLGRCFDILLVDECHQISNSFLELLYKIDAPIRYGMSGTALDSSSAIARAKVKESLGKVVYGIRARQLTKVGVSRDIHVYIHNMDISQYFTERRKLECQSRDWSRIEQAVYTDNEYLHDKIVQIIDEACLKQERTVPTVIFVNKLSQGYKILNKLKAASYNAVFANGSSKGSNSYIAQCIAEFNAGKIDVLIGTSVLTTGHNINYMEQAIIACGGKSKIALTQRLGRANRRKEGHDHIPVHDFYMGHKVVDRHLRVRYAAYEAEAYKVFCLYKHNRSTLTPIYDKSKKN